jgi:hypothetical protein
MRQDGRSTDHSIDMEPRDMEAVEEKKIDGLEEIEKIEDDAANMKPSSDPFTPEEEKRLIRKLDFWYDNILSNSI